MIPLRRPAWAKPFRTFKAARTSHLIQSPRVPPTTCARQFHASASRQFNAVDAGCLQIYNAISLLHSSTGLSWATTIPLAAILIRTMVLFPLLSMSSNATNRLLRSNPIKRCWVPAIRDRVVREKGHLGPEVCQQIVVAGMKAKSAEIDKKYNNSRVRGVVSSLVRLPVWLMAVESIRKMCGARTGLLGNLSGLFEMDNPGITGSAAISVPFEPSLGLEGALWFPNLLLSDSTLLLPSMFAGVMFVNVVLARREVLRDFGKTSKFGERLHRIMLVMSLSLAYITIPAPSAMLIYCIASSGTAIVHRAVIRKLLPKPFTAAPLEARARQRLTL